MSFDIFFQACRWGDPERMQGRRLTKEGLASLKCADLDTEEATAVRRLIDAATPPDQIYDGWQYVVFPDGGSAEVRGLESMSPVFGITPQLAQFFYDMLDAGRWTMIAAMDPLIALTTERGRHWGIPDSFPPIVLCHDAQDIHQHLTGGWKKFNGFLEQVRGWNASTGPIQPPR